ncbi:DUF4430 domain-containing protein [Clostridium sp. UBA1056]|uniref:DUF4430 domain-containing protein n=1 Tax=unclassified Clostridium TaxID=2614128 RepID=UPI0032169469
MIKYNKKDHRNIKISMCIAVLIMSLIFMIGCSKGSEGNLSVTYSIIGSNKEEFILKDYNIKVNEETTVYEGLAMTCKENKIPLSTTGKGVTVYIQGINSLFEFDEGPKSGWIYRVNGEIPDKNAGTVMLKDGDKVEWLYTKELGEDWK